MHFGGAGSLATRQKRESYGPVHLFQILIIPLVPVIARHRARVNILDEILPEAGAFYVMDRGYIDFEPLLNTHRRAGPESISLQGARFENNGATPTRGASNR